MTIFKLILNSLRHYFKSGILIAIGVTVTTAVLTGALIVGDSVIYSLEQSARLRLGDITHAVTSGDRFFTTRLAESLNNENITTTPVLKLEAIASTEGGQMKLNKVNIWGIDPSSFIAPKDQLPQTNFLSISSNLAQRLNLSKGDELNLIIKKAGLIPANAPFVSDEHQNVTYRAKISEILPTEGLGRLSLQNTQTAPFNAFIPLQVLDSIMELENRANVLLVSSSESEKKISEIILSGFTLEDINLSIRSSDITNQWEIISDRVFIDDATKNAVENTGLEFAPVFTYFANSVSFNGKETPYSFISSLSAEEIDANEMVINRWLSEDIGANSGDSVTMKYYTIGHLRELTENTRKFRVSKVVEIEDYFADRSLMPMIPGLSDAENCRDWQTGVPINLKTIRAKDEDYWYNYRGLPKAFISLNTAQDIWKNLYGSVTSFRLSRDIISEDELTEVVRAQTNPFELGFQIRNVKEEGLSAARNGTDFSSLFIGLSFFIIIAALILTSLLFNLHIERRTSEIGTLSAVGFSNKSIRRIFLREGVIIAIAGALAGILLAFIYNELIFYALNKVWNDIVRTDVLVSKYKLSTIILGFAVSVFISAITIRQLLNRTLRLSKSRLQRHDSEESPKGRITFELIISIILSAFALGVIIAQFTSGGSQNPGLFFMAGGSLLIVFILIADIILSKETINNTSQLTIKRLLSANIKHNRKRNLTIIILLSIATFIVVTTGLNRKDLFRNADNKNSGSGGYLLVSESTLPVLHNLNDKRYRNEMGFTEEFSAVQFSVAEGDDASCLNLNRISNPAVMGVDAEKLKGRFSFQTFAPGISKDSGWEILQDKHSGCIPAIADQTVIQWGLGKKVGDTLTYLNSKGEEVKLLLVAGLKPSIFQGRIIIDNSYFLENFINSGGSGFFLIDGDKERKQEISDELELLLRDNGIETEEAPERLARFLSVENTYLSIFLVLGALGLLIGTIGLAVVLQRTLIERKGEFSLLASLGYKRKTILWTAISEYAILLLAGVLAGLLAAFVSVFPVIASSISDISPGFVIMLIAVVIVNGMLWIVISASSQLKKMNPVEGLRNE